MIFILTLVLGLPLTASAAQAPEFLEVSTVPVPPASVQLSTIPDGGETGGEVPEAVKFCDTLEGWLADLAYKKEADLKMARPGAAGGPAARQKKKEIADYEAKARQLCGICRAQREHAEKIRDRNDKAGMEMSDNLLRMSDALEKMASDFFEKARKLSGEPEPEAPSVP